MKVLIALSGGPESLVTAWLLKKQGMQVRGVYFDLEGNPNTPERITQLERKLGISIQVIQSKEEFLKKFSEASEEALDLGQILEPRPYFHRHFLLPKLFELTNQFQYDKAATGHRVLLQEDQVAKVMRVFLQGTDFEQSEAALILGCSQENLKRLITPLGSIPVSMLSKLSAELNPSAELLALDFKWDQIQLPAVTSGFDIVDETKGIKKLGVVKPGVLMIPGSIYQVPEEHEMQYRVVDLIVNEKRVLVEPVPKLKVSEIIFEEISWFSVQDLKLKSLECGAIHPGQAKSLPLKLIQFEGGRAKGFLTHPKKAEEVNIFKGQTMLWVEESEVLGGGRVLGTR